MQTSILNSSFDIFTNIELSSQSAIGKLDGSTIIQDILPYAMEPRQQITNYDDFVNTFVSKMTDTSILDADVAKLLFNTKVKDGIFTIYTIIEYPVRESAIFKFETSSEITYGILLYAYTIAYQLMYALEEEDDADPGHIPGMVNRDTSNGRFGIWGHDIGDLAYNGRSQVWIHDHRVVCNFICDS